MQWTALLRAAASDPFVRNRMRTLFIVASCVGLLLSMGCVNRSSNLSDRETSLTEAHQKWVYMLRHTEVPDFPRSVRLWDSAQTKSETVADKFLALQDALRKANRTPVPIFLSPEAALAVVPGWEPKQLIGDHLTDMPLELAISNMCTKLKLAPLLTEEGVLISKSKE